MKKTGFEVPFRKNNKTNKKSALRKIVESEQKPLARERILVQIPKSERGECAVYW